MRRAIDKVQIRLAIEPAKGRVGQLKDIDVLNVQIGVRLPKRQLDRLGGPKMTRSHGGGKNENAFRHGVFSQERSKTHLKAMAELLVGAACRSAGISEDRRG